MKILRFASPRRRCCCRWRRPSGARPTLRIGLAEDPDVLDPTLARTYVGRIVFASICDKLFDIDEKLNIVPQLALGHETSADGKTVTIKLRPGVKFHDGEPFDAEAAKYTLERHLTMQGSFRKPEIAAIDTVEVVDPLTIKLYLKAPFSPLLAQLTDRAGMMVSPKAAEGGGRQVRPEAGLRRALQVRRARPAGPHRGREVRRLLEQGQVFIDRITYLPIVDCTVRLANLQVRRPRPDRARARDRHQGRCATIRSSSSARRRRLGYQGLTINLGNGRRPRRRSARTPACARRFELVDRPRGASTRSCSTASSCRATSGSARRTRTISRSSRCRSATSPRPRRCSRKPASPTPIASTSWCRTVPRRGGRRGRAVDGGRGRLRPEDPRHRVRDLAEAGRGRATSRST